MKNFLCFINAFFFLFIAGPRDPKPSATGEGTSQKMFFVYYGNDDSSDADTEIFKEDATDDEAFQPSQAPAAAKNGNDNGSVKRNG